jgi:uncharacterized protein (DUF608 family)
MIAMPLGGVGAGSVSLGGRGQLRDWEIFNRPDKGNAPSYAFASIRVQPTGGAAVTRILEGRHLPPYEGSSGLGANNSPGMPRFAEAAFSGEFPLATVELSDPKVPVRVTLEAFSPFIPLDAEESGLPVAVLRYKVRNPGGVAARVSIAYSLEAPAGLGAPRAQLEQRKAEWFAEDSVQGWMFSTPSLATDDAHFGSFVLGLVNAPAEQVTHARWLRAKWWDSPLLYWDDFSDDGALGPEAEKPGAVASLCLSREIPARGEAEWTFLLAWHFPNRTPERCGWSAPKDQQKTYIGNHYCVRFEDARAAAMHAGRNLAVLEERTRAFLRAVRESSLPGAVKDAALSNLSTLCTTTSFRTADGEFHGFEGVNDKAGCCYGNCTHVWNYETATAHLFPSLSRSLRGAAFGYSLDDAGAIHFRQKLPDGRERSGFAAADGQMGQVMKVFMDWRMSGDNEWLKALWPRVKKALEFAWIENGWDADKDGVMEGVQHNTYDVEFFGPNPECGVYYLGALRAGEEMARAMGDPAAADEYRRVFESGRKWIDANLFNGEFYIQKIRPVKREAIAAALVGPMGFENPEAPEYQVGEGCLADQLIGQYLAEVCGLGLLLDEGNVRKTLQSIHRYNFKRELSEHQNVQRTYALNDEAALLVCDYKPGTRPKIPFPYFAELFTGIEYTAAAGMLYAGLVKEGLEVVEAVRRRYDGERRNPYNEAECGHHYARAMAAWSCFLALAGFRYHAAAKTLEVRPRLRSARFRSFWSCGTGWGVFTQTWAEGKGELVIEAREGTLALAEVVWAEGAKKTSFDAVRIVDRDTPLTLRSDG